MGVVAGLGEVSSAAFSSRPVAAALAAQVVGGVVGADFSERRQPPQVQSLNFILLCMAASGRGVTRHTEQGG